MKPVELVPTSGPTCPSPRAAKGRFIKGKGAAVKLTVTTRRQTPQEARQFNLAFDLFVAEMVRRELSRLRGK